MRRNATSIISSHYTTSLTFNSIHCINVRDVELMKMKRTHEGINTLPQDFDGGSVFIVLT